MIEFPCLCGNDFSLPMTMAGESFQCPRCMRLVSVPTLDDLALLNPDGTYNFDPAPVDLQRRGENPAPPADSQMAVRFDGLDIGPEEFQSLPPTAPRYDPETGELIRAIGVTDVVISAEEQTRPLPVPLRKSMALVIVPPSPEEWILVLRRMFRAREMVVISAMFGIHLMIVLIYALAMQGLVIFYFAPVVMAVVVLGQYSAIVQETGPEQMDELPRPMRDFDFTNDLWLPMLQTSVANLISFAPAAIWFSNDFKGRLNDIGTIIWIVFGFCVLPAVLLTASVDGVIKNFRPDRLLRIITLAKWEYVRAALSLALGTALLADSLWGMATALEIGFGAPGTVFAPAHWYYVGGWISLLFLPAALYFSYYACWLIGLIWRGHQHHFNWVSHFSSEAESTTSDGLVEETGVVRMSRTPRTR